MVLSQKQKQPGPPPEVAAKPACKGRRCFAALAFKWESGKGCCREMYFAGDETSSGKIPKPSSHQDTAVVVWYPGTSAETANKCSAKCAIDATCFAVEVTKRKKETKCEYHTSSINARTRATQSCKKSTCAFKVSSPVATLAPTPAPTPVDQTLPPTASPTAAPSPAPPGWNEKKGCCRERNGKTSLSHQLTAATETLTGAGSFDTAVAACKDKCAGRVGCNAAEIRRKNIKSMSGSSQAPQFQCELHTATGINSASRSTKSCKKARCVIRL